MIDLIFEILIRVGFVLICFADDRGCDIDVERAHGFKPTSNSKVHRGQTPETAPSKLQETALPPVEKFGQIQQPLQGQKLLQAFLHRRPRNRHHQQGRWEEEEDRREDQEAESGEDP